MHPKLEFDALLPGAQIYINTESVNYTASWLHDLGQSINSLKNFVRSEIGFAFTYVNDELTTRVMDLLKPGDYEITFADTFIWEALDQKFSSDFFEDLLAHGYFHKASRVVFLRCSIISVELLRSFRDQNRLVFDSCYFMNIRLGLRVGLSSMSQKNIADMLVAGNDSEILAFSRVACLVAPRVQELVIRNCELSIIELDASKTEGVLFERCVIRYQPKLARALSSKADIPPASLVSSYAALASHPDLVAFKTELNRFRLLFESESNWIKRQLFRFNGGYYNLIAPLAATILLGAGHFVCGLLASGSPTESARALINPLGFFGLSQIVLADIDFSQPFSPPKVIMASLIPLYVYSLYSAAIAIKRWLGFGRPENRGS